MYRLLNLINLILVINKTILTLPLGVSILFQTHTNPDKMDRFIFHWMDKDHDDIYTYAKDRDKALQSLGPWITDAALPGLSNVPTTGAETPNGSLYYQHLLASGKKNLPVVPTCYNLGILDCNILSI